MDATLQSREALERPITDCSGLELLIGDKGLPLLGEISFFARALTAEEMEEIMGSGFTLQSIAAGKLPFAPQETLFDNAASANKHEFLTAQSERADSEASMHLESSQVRQAIEIADEVDADTIARQRALLREPNISVSSIAPCEAVVAMGDESSCSIMTLEEADAQRDATTGKEFFSLIQPEYLPKDENGKQLTSLSRVFLDHNHPGQSLSYDTKTFPSFCGKSATFSLWWESSTESGGHVISRYASSDVNWPAHCWLLYVNEYGLSVLGNHPDGSPRYTAALPSWFQKPLGSMERMSRRHVAFVFDKPSDKIKFYLDGHLLDEHQYAAGFVGKMDCGMQGKGSYTGFGHRLPGVGATVGAVQDWRYYRDSLSAQEIQKLAMESVGDDGRLLRTCVLPEKIWDQDWHDLNGNDCAWYAEHQSTTSHNICASKEVRKSCPLACNADKPCWMGEQPAASTYTIWNRIMFLSEKQPGDGVVCVRQGIDAVKECEVLESYLSANPNSNSAGIGALGLWWTSHFRAYKDIRLDDCEALRRTINPYCGFVMPRNLNAEIASNAGYSLSFWWKALDSTIVEARFYGSCRSTDVEDVEIGSKQGTYKDGEWYHFAAVFNAKTHDGKRSVMIKYGLKSSYDRADFDWCAAKNSEFMQGMQLPGGVLVSPMQITAAPATEHALQRLLYDTQSSMRARRGPLNDDTTRMTSTIRYQRSPYSYRMSLVAPPIVLQTRVEKTEICPNKLGTVFHRKAWMQTVNGSACKMPYECDEDLLNSSTELLACSGTSSPASFFGRDPLHYGGKIQFYEFLQSITDAALLIRDNKPQETQGFLDGQTQSVEVTMVAYAADYGMASTIHITAVLGSSVSVDYKVEHFAALEGQELEEYRKIVIVGFILAGVIFMEKIITVLHKQNSAKVRLEMMVDMVVQVILPVIYFSVRYQQVSASGDALLHTVGEQGFGGVPWSSRSEGFEAKMQRFFAGLEKFEQSLAQERLMHVFYFIHGTSALCRVIVQTSAHPRTAILVDTFVKGCTDLWHFFILFCLIQSGFILLAWAQFADTQKEFSTPWVCFETMWKLFLGEMLESGEIPSSMWSSNIILMTFLLLYNVMVFMTMLNFIIAIIIDAYMKVVNVAKLMEAEQEFFTDVIHVSIVSAKSWLHLWPGHICLFKACEMLRSSKLDYMILRKLFPRKSHKSLISFLKHYAHYDFINIGKTSRAQEGGGCLSATANFLWSGSANEEEPKEISPNVALLNDITERCLFLCPSLSVPVSFSVTFCVCQH